MRGLYWVLEDLLPRLREHKNSVIIGVETAAKLNKLSPTKGVPVTLLVREDIDLDTDTSLVEIIKVDNLDFTGLNTFQGVYVSGKERTIADMIKLDRDPQTITEAVCHYYVTEGEDWALLDALGEREGILDELRSYYDDALAHIEY